MTIDRNCLDAETVAAWMDGGLDAAGVAAAEAHASTCERCQELLATVATTLPATRLAPGTQPARGTLSFWWLAPLAGTAAAVTIWMVVPQTPMQTPMQPPAAPAPARDMAADTPGKPQAPAEAEAQAPPARVATPPESLAGSRRNVPTPPAKEATAKLATGADTSSASARERSGELRRDEQAKREENSVRAAQLRKQTGPLQIVSPDPSSRWRALPGVVERSEDGGRVWIPVRLGANEEVIGGASPRPLVCWLVGRNGLVLLATDGTNFTRLPFPESVDLVAVTSPEPRIATVTTADGRTFRTEDAGRSWSLQEFPLRPF